jgi:hypothetical protein
MHHDKLCSNTKIYPKRPKKKREKVLHNDKYHDTKITGNDAKEEQTVVESREDSEQGAARVCESR